MQRRYGRSLVAGALLCVALHAQGSQAQSIVMDLTNLVQNTISAVQEIAAVSNQGTQLANDVTKITNQATQIVHQVEQIANQVQQIEYLLAQLEEIQRQAEQSGSLSWGQVRTTMDALVTATRIGDALVYSLGDVAGAFETAYPGYVPPTDWNAAQEQWSRTTMDTLRGALNSAGMNLRDIKTVEAALQSLEAANNGATGRNELIEVGNSLASLQVQEMAKLRQLMALEINAQTVWAGSQVNREAASDAALERFIGTVPSAGDPRTAPGFGLFPRP